MENFSYSSYPDSGNSSPRSREIDENQSWDEPPSNYKVKFMCSYGGKIQPRPHDNQLAYVGGDTKILSVERNVKFAVVMSKLTSLCDDGDICLKYQLPGEDLDALISVTNDEDLEHMMLEYDRLYRASAKPARLRLFLFHSSPLSYGSDEVKSERQWFVDALNSVQVHPLEGSSPLAAVSETVSAANPDFLFGLDKGFPSVPVKKLTDTVPAVPEVIAKDVKAGSEYGSEDMHAIYDSGLNQQTQDSQKLQIGFSQEQAILNRKLEANSRGAEEYYVHQVVETAPAPVAVPVQMPIPAAYLPERHMTSTGYPIAAGRTEQPVYLISTATGLYQAPALRPVAGQLGQNYYGVQRVVQEGYREQPVYSAMPLPTTAASLQHQQPPKVGVYTEGVGVVPPKVGVPEQGYAQVGYDSAGRQVIYTAPYQAVAMVADGRPAGGALNQDGKVVAANTKVPQTSL